MSYKELLKEVTDLCRQVYGREFHEVFGFDITKEDLEKWKQYLLKKQQLKKATIKNRKFFNLWRKYWNTKIVAQPILCDLYALCFVSQLLKHVKIYRGFEEDLRIHLCIIAPSGMGKTEGNNLLAEIVKSLRKPNLKYKSVERYTDAVLTGSYDKQAIEHNIKHNLKPGDDDYKDPYKPSILVSNDFVVYDEGENILKTSSSTEGAQRILQKAMNRHGSEGNYISNELISHSVGDYPNCSVIITSYYLSEFKETLLHRGLLQRMIVYICGEDESKRDEIIRNIIYTIPDFDKNPDEAFTKLEKMKADEKRYLKALKNEIRKLYKYHQETKYVVIKRDAKDILKKYIDELRNIMPFLTGQKQIWESMVSRLTNNSLKVAAIYALLDYRNYIDKNDIEEAAKLLMETMKTLAIFIKENVKTELDVKTMRYYQFIKREFAGEKMTKDEWIKRVAKHYSLSEQSAGQIIECLKENGKFKIHQDGTMIIV